ncbi:BTB domain-containing protein [Favolaschia claudopus]|uniref:BTB domain-containing protein n=1 Tax=Favolaschia claudopus TaxID=2862362 RepID=A0AAW0B5U5_9AGAR
MALPKSQLQRSTEYWFDDGNIILQVESTQFRLIKSVLSMHSNVFRDMFTLPLPNDEPTVEGSPVVVLSGDTSRDWKLFLGAMYPKRLMDELPSLELITAILRLSKKYDCPVFRQDCIQRLKSDFPTKLSLYDESDDSWSFQEEDDMFMPILALAKEIGLHSILPTLYCIMLTMERETYLPIVLDVEDTRFSTADRLACTLGIVNLLRLQSETTMAWLSLDAQSSSIPAKSCIQGSMCVAAVKKIILDLAEAHHPDIYVLDIWVDEWGTDLCRACRKKAKEVYKTGRKTCWNKLPGAFGLSNWDVLESLDLE